MIWENITLSSRLTCQGRIVSALEGGYDLNGLGRCVVALIRALQHSK